MTYLDDIIHFSSNNRTKNTKMFLILSPRVTFGKSAVKILSKNNFLVCGVLWRVVNVFISVHFPEMRTMIFV
jgi:hypothetical protein